MRHQSVRSTNQNHIASPSTAERKRWEELRHLAEEEAMGGRPLTAWELDELRRLNRKFLGPLQNPDLKRRLLGYL